MLPRGSTKTDWEVELGVVVGRRARYVARDSALAHVAGYCTINDVSEREYQMQTGNTRTMIFGVADIVAYVSEFMTLQPGDVITTGTPPGVGSAKSPPRFLSAGDVVTLGIEGLGEQEQAVVPFAL